VTGDSTTFAMRAESGNTRTGSLLLGSARWL
jgi:hypothetical protein